MSVITLEIKPDRLLMDPNFDGYKLSLEELKFSKQNLKIPTGKALLNPSKSGLLHAKLFGLHNHLIYDRFDQFFSVYFIDKQFNIQKAYVDNDSEQLVEPVNVYSIPNERDVATGDYNATLCFASPEYAVASDGMGLLYVLNTKDKKNDDQFECVFSDKVLDNGEKGFVVSDALYHSGKQELHVLLLHIEEDDSNRFVSVIHWLTFKGSFDNNWGQVGLKQLKTKGEIQYLHLEINCDHVYVVSENPVKFTLNSEHPIEENIAETQRKNYQWIQNFEDITLRYPLEQNCQKNLIKVIAENRKITISYNANTLLEGELGGPIDASLLTWSLVGDILEVSIVKSDPTMWSKFIKEDQQGEHLIEPINERPQGLTRETEMVPQSGQTFHSQQIEECDFETDKSEVFLRISGLSNKVTHQIHLGSHQVLLSQYLDSVQPPALGIRRDVDVCLWQPKLDQDGNFFCKHEGTLLAFGYVQASKTNRKYLSCSPNLSYSVVSESAGHIFIYRQNKPLLGGNLRNRTTGQQVKNVAQQQVFHLINEDILGIVAANQYLYILGETFILVLILNDS
ncbi:hypothetical protein ABEB36_001712 [Hypothenemus hampei]|uniref:NudC domain-containing protein 1 n=1 Tax=Hypothenemus hampei TaxID=57062 RepID=A0ABD1FFI1_HYPHA